MPQTKTTRYDVAEHLLTPKDLAAYLEASIEEAQGDVAWIAKALRNIARAAANPAAAKRRAGRLAFRRRRL